MPIGTLCKQQLQQLVQQQHLVASEPLNSAQVQPASIDVRLGRTCYEQKYARLPLQHGSHTARYFLDRGFTFKRGHIYTVQCKESLRLDANTSAICNGKSTAGRLDMMVRLLCDGATQYNYVPRGYSGSLWLEITPRTFDVVLTEDHCVAQLRFFDGGMQRVKRPEQISIDLSGEVAGYVSNGGVVDYAKLDHNKWQYWSPLPVHNDESVLWPGQFYVLRSLETVSIEPDQAAELEPINTRYGEFRLHYAGFVDPGFCGRLVLEVRPFEVPIVLRHAQPIGQLWREAMSAVPDELYGAQNSYQNQTLKLAKQFC